MKFSSHVFTFGLLTGGNNVHFTLNAISVQTWLNLRWFVYAELLGCFKISLHCDGTFNSNSPDYQENNLFSTLNHGRQTHTYVVYIHTKTRTHISITSNIPCGARSRSTRESEVITHLGYMSITTRMFISSIAGGLWPSFSLILRLWPLLFHSLSVPLHMTCEDIRQALA